MAIPFTKSISVAVGEWILDKRLVHLIVTGGGTPFSVEAELYNSESFQRPSQTVSMTLGK